MLYSFLFSLKILITFFWCMVKLSDAENGGVGTVFALFVASLPIEIFFFIDHGWKGVVFLLIVSVLNIVVGAIGEITKQAWGLILVIIYVFAGSFYVSYHYIPYISSLYQRFWPFGS